MIKKVWNAVRTFGRKAWGYIKGMNGKRAGAFLGGAAGAAVSSIPFVGQALGPLAVPALTSAGAYLGSYAQDQLEKALEEKEKELDYKYGFKKMRKENERRRGE